MSDKVFKLQLLTEEVVRNPALKSSAFLLFAKLCELYGRCKSELLEVNHTALKNYLSVSDNRSLKLIFNNMYENKLILNEIKSFPKKKALQVHINKEMTTLHSKNYFTQVDIRLLDKRIVDQIGSVGVRLIYYYESRINRLELYKDRCYASISTISQETGISKNTIMKYNEILKKNKLIRIKKHKLEHAGWEKDGNMIDYVQYANHTYVKLENITKLIGDSDT
ncbi:hypothetical protein [Halalkalibacter oceani]|uniref:hypothetical protein n=1 Tax=Halalkalibacter oceani TaxID=1653776 RepID=UPI003391C8C6